MSTPRHYDPTCRPGRKALDPTHRRGLHVALCRDEGGRGHSPGTFQAHNSLINVKLKHEHSYSKNGKPGGVLADAEATRDNDVDGAWVVAEGAV